MANPHFLTGAAGTLSGGSWDSDYPLTNLLTTQPGQTARSTDATEASTQFILDRGSSLPLSMVAFVNHNLSQGAPIQIVVSDNSDGSDPALDVTTRVDIATVVWGSRPWGAFPWSGVEDDFPGGFTSFYLHDETVSGRYVLVNISDEGNSDGHAEIGCFLAGVPFVPALGLSFGARVGLIDDSTKDRAVGAGIYSNQKPKRRMVSGSLGFLTRTEALGELYDLQNYAGRSKGVLFVLDPDDASGMRMRRTIYGSFSDLGAMTEGSVQDMPYSWSFALEELI